MGAREKSYSAALSICSEVNSCLSSIAEAKNSLNSQLSYVEFYWTGKSGAAMHDKLSSLVEEMNYLSVRLNALYSNMKSSSQYDYSLWPEPEEEK